MTKRHLLCALSLLVLTLSFISPSSAQTHRVAGPATRPPAAPPPPQTSTVYRTPIMFNSSQVQAETTKEVFSFAELLGDASAKVAVKPQDNGLTEIIVRFRNLSNITRNDVKTRFVLWAVSPDNKVVSLGQVYSVGRRSSAEVKTETAFPNFGLFVTAERAENASPQAAFFGPTGPMIAAVGAHIGPVFATLTALPPDNLNVKYCRLADCPETGKGPWNDASTGATGSFKLLLDHPAKYAFVYVDRNGQQIKKEVPCYSNCTVTFDTRLQPPTGDHQ